MNEERRGALSSDRIRGGSKARHRYRHERIVREASDRMVDHVRGAVASADR
jgi:hypothetical protein